MITRWNRFFYQPCLPLGPGKTLISGSAEHIALSKEAAGEGMVLLKNEGHSLPLPFGKKVVLLGKASEEYVKGGGGSGDVTVAYTRNLYEGMKIKEGEGKVQVYDGLHDFYSENIREQFASGREKGMTVEPELPEALLAEAAAYTDTAILCFCRFSGEGWDRRCLSEQDLRKAGVETWEGEMALKEAGSQIFQRGDFYLSDEENALLKKAKENFPCVIAVLNVGGVVDTNWFVKDEGIPAVLLAWQGGIEGGLAAAEILCGDVNPSGKLTDTFARQLEDYPSSPGFHDSVDYVEYKEDIYVGYRYFETIPGMKEKVNYPFGYGLSYTDFEISVNTMEQREDHIFCGVSVKNTGSRPGKEVVQLYYSAPQGKLGKPNRVLGAFRKTALLAPGETEELELSFPVADMASYDDLGKIQKSAYLLERGEYTFYVGNSVRNAAPLSWSLKLDKDVVTQQLNQHLTPSKLGERMVSDGSFEPLERKPFQEVERPEIFKTPEKMEGVMPEARAVPRENRGEFFHPSAAQLSDVADGKITLEEFMDDLTLEEQVWLLGGQPNTGVANTFGMGNNQRHGIPNVMTADGPAGLRIHPYIGVYTTAWPCATMLACTWNCDLAERVGAAGALEVKENNIGIWLTPAMNIHRSPLCGRNFEYYSEDPLIAGRMAAAVIRGIQSQKIAATPKHFALNNKETNRKHSDSRVSERAAREIYLKGFEIAVKTAHPMMLMTSYNIINGVNASENKELITDILRGEWGFDGAVTTDWWTRAEHYREIKAGNDVKMGCGFPEEVLQALEEGKISREEIRSCARRVLEMILKLG